MNDDEFQDEKYSFACTCSPEGIKKVKKVMRWARKYLGNKEYPTTDKNFTSKVMYALGWQYHARVEFFSDQWGSIMAEGFKWTNPDEPESQEKTRFSTSVQCDEFEYGLAYVLKQFVEFYGDDK